MEGSCNDGTKATGLSGVIEVKEEQVRLHLSQVVREAVEETLNAMLEAAAAHRRHTVGNALLSGPETLRRAVGGGTR